MLRSCFCDVAWCSVHGRYRFERREETSIGAVLVGLVANAEKLEQTTKEMLDIYATNPDGSAHSMGTAAVCWNCGYCGLPRDETAKAPRCGACDSDDANWLKVTRTKGAADVPWIQKKALTPEEKKKKDEATKAAKRAEIEANVKRALEERRAAAAKGNADAAA